MSAPNGAALAVRQEAQITQLPRHDPGAVMEQVIVKGDLSQLQPEERARYYVAICESVGLNPLTRPFQYIDFGDKGGGLQIYARKEAAEQLRGIHKIQTRIVDRSIDQDIYIVVVEAHHPDGRVETDIGAVPIHGLAAQFLANAMKKAISQGKRRATLAMMGLPQIDEDELRTVSGARIVEVDPATGEIGPSSFPAIHEAEPIPVDPKAAWKDEVAAFFNAVKAAFAIDLAAAKPIAKDVVSLRFDLDDANAATVEQIHEARAAVESWSPTWAPKALEWLRMVGSAETESMAVDVGALLDEQGVTDPFVHAALADFMARFDQRGVDDPDVFATSGAVIDAALVP